MDPQYLNRIDVATTTIVSARRRFFGRCLAEWQLSRVSRAAVYQRIIEASFQGEKKAQLFLELGANLRSARELHTYICRCILWQIPPSDGELIDIELHVIMIEASAESAAFLLS